MPDAILIAGANGAGKTTFARQFLRVLYPAGTFLNADEIQRCDPRFSHPFAAGRELLRRVSVLEALGATFAVETTLSSTQYARKLRAWSRRYGTTLHFIELPSADYAVERVARRVAAGGHFVREVDIRRRFERGLQLFQAVFKPLPDRWYHWFSDDGGLRLVDEGQNGSGRARAENPARGRPATRARRGAVNKLFANVLRKIGDCTVLGSRRHRATPSGVVICICRRRLVPARALASSTASARPPGCAG